MSMEDSEAWEIDWEKHCIVCGKSVLDGEGFAHLRVECEMVAICCPLCFENFEKKSEALSELAQAPTEVRPGLTTAQRPDRGKCN